MEVGVLLSAALSINGRRTDTLQLLWGRTTLLGGLEEIVLCVSLLPMYVVIAQRINGESHDDDTGEIASKPQFNVSWY